ncbi:hypothetical protein HMN09_01406100 [Mycena chlorophos]|uniref:Uncharacterized protein n=1 Tax=Mycena chlorophos TaxID=658473 RepID=A0A8H6VQI2_MYCCL|nr:hypothetical protein HMN09_01406100 [Mycena chlorophos]
MAVFLHNAIFVPDPDAEPDSPGLPTPGHTGHNRTTSTSSLHTLTVSESSHPLLPTTSEPAYLDLLARQPAHPSLGRRSALSFDGDPTTAQERKEQEERVLRRRLVRLRYARTGLEVIVGGWAVYTTTRYFLALAKMSGLPAGEGAATALGTTSAGSIFALVASVLIPRLRRRRLLPRPFAVVLLRYATALLVLAPAFVNFVLVFAWRTASSAALDKTGVRCGLDIDVVWSIGRGCGGGVSDWGHWLVLAIVRLLVTVAVLTIYLLSVTSYDETRHHGRHASSDSTFHPSPPMSANPSSASVNPKLTPAPERRSLRRSQRPKSTGSSRSGSQSPKHSAVATSSTSRTLYSDHNDFDPYADLPSPPASTASGSGSRSTSPPTGLTEADRELYSFVDRFRSLVSQVSQETEYGRSISPPAPAVNEFGLPVGSSSASARRDADRVLILNSYIRRMPTIESLGSREVGSGTGTTTGAPSIAGSSDYGGSVAGGRRPSTSRPASLSMSVVGSPSIPPSAAPTPTTPTSLSLARISALVEGGAVEQSPQLDSPVARVMRRTSNASASSSGSFYTSSPAHTPIAEEPPELGLGPLAPPGLPSRASVRPLPRPPPPSATFPPMSASAGAPPRTGTA